MSNYYEIIVYTAAVQEYADKVIDYIDKTKVISRRLYRSDCYRLNNGFYKDVASHGYQQNKVVIIDDMPNSHIKYRDNVVGIKVWNGTNERDDSLLKLRNILRIQSQIGDVEQIVNNCVNNDV